MTAIVSFFLRQPVDEKPTPKIAKTAKTMVLFNVVFIG
jgi:hypothetical protein